MKRKSVQYLISIIIGVLVAFVLNKPLWMELFIIVLVIIIFLKVIDLLKKD